MPRRFVKGSAEAKAYMASIRPLPGMRRKGLRRVSRNCRREGKHAANSIIASLKGHPTQKRIHQVVMSTLGPYSQFGIKNPGPYAPAPYGRKANKGSARYASNWSMPGLIPVGSGGGMNVISGYDYAAPVIPKRGPIYEPDYEPTTTSSSTGRYKKRK